MIQETLKTEQSNPRIYVVSIADFHGKKSHGQWIAANQNAGDIYVAIAKMLTENNEPDEGWIIWDYENFGGIKLSELESLELVAQLGGLISKHGELFGALVKQLGGLHKLDEAKQSIVENYFGVYGNVESFLANFIKDEYRDILDEIPVFLLKGFDYEGLARSLLEDGDFFLIEFDDEVHVFRDSA